MTAILATRAARRRGIIFTVLLVATVLMMAFSSNPAVREFQNAVGFAFRPIQGALDGAAGSVASVAAGASRVGASAGVRIVREARGDAAPARTAAGGY